MGKDSCLPVQGTEEAWVRSLDQEDPLEEEMATHCSILVWRIPWTKEPGRHYVKGKVVVNEPAG